MDRNGQKGVSLGTAPSFTFSHGSPSERSFRQWHRRMQTEHDILQQAGKIGFGLWGWCRYVCIPCRWFDSIDQEKKLCRSFLKFKTLKKLITILLIAVFVYIFMYGVFGDQFLPGGTGFFIYLLTFVSYVAGYLLLFAGLPNMFGNILVGVILGNLPKHWLPYYDAHLLHTFVQVLERILLTLALLRSGLYLDLSRIKTRVRFILKLAFIPIIFEFFSIFPISCFAIGLPWNWSALLGSILIIASLVSITTIMQNNKQNGYGEDKHLSTVLIASSTINMVIGVTLYAIFGSCLHLSAQKNWGLILLGVLKETGLGVAVGFLFGLVCGFFPDKHLSTAPLLRIFILGLSEFSIAALMYRYHMTAGGVLGLLILSITASNIWEEIGWHSTDNPVHYFYNLVFIAAQPLVLVHIGFSLNFWEAKATEIGLSLAVIVVAVTVRSSVCFLSIYEKTYPTTWKEKIFICIAWFSKGTFEVLLAFEVEAISQEHGLTPSDPDYERQFYYIRMIRQTVILAVLLTTPFVYYTLTTLTPKLLFKLEYPPTPPIPDNPD